MAHTLLEESHTVPQVIALYRYPVKGFTPEVCKQLTILPGGRVAGDRVLHFRFADAPVADDEWCRKYHGVVLANTPGLARLHVHYDAHVRRLRMEAGAQVLADEALDAAGRARLVGALTSYVQSLADNPLQDHPERLPVKLVGDGIAPRYQDNMAGQTTLHSRESLASAGVALGDAALDERRFRHNIVIDGVHAWQEQEWIGHKVCVGGVIFETIVPKVRCLATHANPRTGERDLEVMQTLVRAFRQQQPTFGIGMLSAGGGEIRLGDAVAVLD
jgi:uncharacterized protein